MCAWLCVCVCVCVRVCVLACACVRNTRKTFLHLPVMVVARASTAATLPKKVMRVLPRCRKECMDEDEEGIAKLRQD